ncbi:MAG: hypothetical protein WCT31_02750 [Candidatus Micrarchaeia archaeon]|jgi:hypothetical protein
MFETIRITAATRNGPVSKDVIAKPPLLEDLREFNRVGFLPSYAELLARTLKPMEDAAEALRNGSPVHDKLIEFVVAIRTMPNYIHHLMSYLTVRQLEDMWIGCPIRVIAGIRDEKPGYATRYVGAAYGHLVGEMVGAQRYRNSEEQLVRGIDIVDFLDLILANETAGRIGIGCNTIDTIRAGGIEDGIALALAYQTILEMKMKLNCEWSNGIEGEELQALANVYDRRPYRTENLGDLIRYLKTAKMIEELERAIATGHVRAGNAVFSDGGLLWDYVNYFNGFITAFEVFCETQRPEAKHRLSHALIEDASNFKDYGTYVYESIYRRGYGFGTIYERPIDAEKAYALLMGTQDAQKMQEITNQISCIFQTREWDLELAFGLMGNAMKLFRPDQCASRDETTRNLIANIHLARGYLPLKSSEEDLASATLRMANLFGLLRLDAGLNLGQTAR